MKPDARIYRDLVNACAVDAKQIVFIDDNRANVESAKESGINALLFTSVQELESDLRGLGIEWE